MELLCRIWFGSDGFLRDSKAPGGKVSQAVGKIRLVLKREAGLLSCEQHRNNSPSQVSENEIGSSPTLP